MKWEAIRNKFGQFDIVEMEGNFPIIYGIDSLAAMEICGEHNRAIEKLKAMNCYKVDRTDKVDWVEDYACVVIAEDAKHAERRARWDRDNFRKAPLKVIEIDLSKEQVVLVANTGA